MSEQHSLYSHYTLAQLKIITLFPGILPRTVNIPRPPITVFIKEALLFFQVLIFPLKAINEREQQRCLQLQHSISLVGAKSSDCFQSGMGFLVGVEDLSAFGNYSSYCGQEVYFSIALQIMCLTL